MENLINTTPELFETILDFLPFLDLVMTSGVNRAFHNFITTSSPKLRRKLFLLAVKDPNSQEDDVDKWGIIGRRKLCQEMLFRPPKQRNVAICPYLLNRSSHYMRAAHLSRRAVEAEFWPDVFLTNPPCAHAVVSFTYSCTLKDGRVVSLEGTRSLFRKRGVTLVAIEEALSQRGLVKGKESGMDRAYKMQNTTLYAQIPRWEKRFGCTLELDRQQTIIKLHGDPLPTEEERIVRWD